MKANPSRGLLTFVIIMLSLPATYGQIDTLKWNKENNTFNIKYQYLSTFIS